MSAQPGSPPSDSPGEEHGLTKGATIGRYVVLGLLGRGGMGEVYAAFDPDLDRKIAVKLLRARGANTADGRARLLREAQAIARLSHPNVVVVFDVGTFRESVFIAMEFVEGSTLGYWIQAQTRSWRHVLDVYVAAGQGLVAAHTAGLVHRDFKPDNVMITKGGQVRVMDFGLAREQGAAPDEPSPANLLAADVADQAVAMADTFDASVDPDETAKLGGGGGAEVPSSISGGYLKLKLTQTGTMLGTPAYMAPEQFAATGSDARTDQFSFCVALYEGLYGQRPFAGNNPVELMANVVAGTVTDPPPDAHVPTWIRKILLRGLSTSPKDRFPSMIELLAALAQDPAVRRRRWVSAAAGLAILVGAALGAHRFTTGHQAMCAGGPDRAASAWGPDRRAAVERAFNATGSKNAARAFANVSSIVGEYIGRWVGMYKEACEATHVRGEQSAEVLDLRMECLGERLASVRALGDLFVSADGAVVDNAVNAAGALPSLDRCADIEMLRSVVRPPDDPAVRARVSGVRDDIAKVKAMGDSGQCERAAKFGARVVQAAKATNYLPVEAESSFVMGRLGEDCISPAQATEYLEDASIAAEASRHDELYVESTITAGFFYADRLHDVRRSRDAIRHGGAVLSRLPGHPGLEAWLAEDQAVLELAEGNYEAALKFERRALELRQQLYGPSHYEVASSLNNIAIDLHALHRDAEAAPIMERAMEMTTRLFGPDNARMANYLVNQSEILTSLGRFDAARSGIDRGLAIWRQQNAGNWLIGYGLLDLGRLQVAEGNATAAVKTLGQSIPLLGEEDRLTLAEAKFALAAAVWAAAPRERAHATALAREARGLAADQFGSKRVIDEIDAWQAHHHAG